MGTRASKVLSQEELSEYSELSYLNEAEILHILSRFRQLGSEVDKDRQHRYPASMVIDLFPEFKYNPFVDRIVTVFSSYGDEKFSFEDFLDVCSALSDNCPQEVKAVWAFKIFDFDGDNQINEDDIGELIRRLTAPLNGAKSTVGPLLEEERKYIANIMLDVLDLDKTGAIAKMEFVHAVSKIPEFNHTFRLRI